MKQIIQAMQTLSAEGTPFALATIVTQNGSAPRGAGAKMLVKADNSIEGTVGGGILEAQVQLLALKMIAERSATIQSFEFSGKDAQTMDAICGGRVEVLVEWIDPRNPQMKAVIDGLAAAVQQHAKAWLVTVLPKDNEASTHMLILKDGSTAGNALDGAPLEEIMESHMPYEIQWEGRKAMVEPVNIDGSAYIFGAGHVSRSLAEFTKAVGFWTVVLDDRAEYASRERFPGADEILVPENLAGAVAGLPLDRDSYIIIVTRGHMNDRAVLAAALKTPAGYIGMIGSRRKVTLIFDELRKEGFSDADIQRVSSPIGLPIGAETPEEIGISITAQMIQVRAQMQK